MDCVSAANLLPMLGVPPQLGQWPSAEDDRPGHTHVVLLSDDLWRRRFHGDPHIVGKVIHFDSEGYQVLGVMPRGFNFPPQEWRKCSSFQATKCSTGCRSEQTSPRSHTVLPMPA